jgi:hypothetical protein
MHNERFRRMTTIAGAMLCLIAATSSGQDTSVTTPPTTGPAATTGTAGGPPFDTTTMAAPMGMTDTLATADTDDGFDFPWGLLGLLGLLGLMKRGGGTTVVTRENYTSPPSGTRPGMNRGATATDDRTMNLNPRPGEGTDPNARR